jgi:hypothetical protein
MRKISKIFTIILLQSITAFSATLLHDSTYSANLERRFASTPPASPSRNGLQENRSYEESPTPHRIPIHCYSNSSFNEELSIERSVAPASCDRASSLIPATTLEEGYVAILLHPKSHEDYNTFAESVRKTIIEQANAGVIVKDKQNSLAYAQRLANTTLTDKLIAHISLFQSISAENQSFFQNCVSFGLLEAPIKTPLYHLENELSSLFLQYKALRPTFREDSLNITIDHIVVDGVSVIAKGIASPALRDIHTFFNKYCCYRLKATCSQLAKKHAQDVLNIVKDSKASSDPAEIDSLKNKAMDAFIQLKNLSSPLADITTAALHPDVKNQVVWYILLVELEQSALGINFRDLYFLNDKEKPNHMLALFKRRTFEPHITITQLKKQFSSQIKLATPITVYFNEIYCGNRKDRTKHIAWHASTSSMITNMSLRTPLSDRTNSNKSASLSPHKKRQSSARDISLDQQRKPYQPNFDVSIMSEIFD